MIELNKKLELIDSIEVFYLINNSIATYNHVFKVAEISKNLSKKYNLDSEKCYLSGLIHDISTHLSPIEMLFYAEKHNWLINDIEREYPNLLHQKISSNMATELFDIYDKDILNAINCHTTLKVIPIYMTWFYLLQINYHGVKKPYFLKKLILIWKSH